MARLLVHSATWRGTDVAVKVLSLSLDAIETMPEVVEDIQVINNMVDYC